MVLNTPQGTERTAPTPVKNDPAPTVTSIETEKPRFRLNEPIIQVCPILRNGLEP